MSARMIMKNDYSKRSMPLNWGVSKSLTTSVCIAPPLTTDQATLDELVAGIRNAIATVFGE